MVACGNMCQHMLPPPACVAGGASCMRQHMPTHVGMFLGTTHPHTCTHINTPIVNLFLLTNHPMLCLKCGKILLYCYTCCTLHMLHSSIMSATIYCSSTVHCLHFGRHGRVCSPHHTGLQFPVQLVVKLGPDLDLSSVIQVHGALPILPGPCSAVPQIHS